MKRYEIKEGKEGKWKLNNFLVLKDFWGVPVWHLELLGGYQSGYFHFFWNRVLSGWHLELLGGVPVKKITLYITITAQHKSLGNSPHHHVANDQSKGLTIQLIRSGREGIGRLGIKFMAHEPRLAPSSSPSYNRLTSYNVNYTFPTRLKTNHFLQSTVISVIIKQIPYKMCETSTNADFPVQELFAFFSSKVWLTVLIFDWLWTFRGCRETNRVEIWVSVYLADLGSR